MAILLASLAIATITLPQAVQSNPIRTQDADLITALRQFDQYVEASYPKWKTPGLAIAIIRDGQVIFEKGYGVKRSGTTDRVDADTVFQIGSISKSFTSTLIGTLVDAEELTFEDTVIDTLPAFRMYDPWVTRQFQVRDLMSQRSGMAPYSGDLMAMIGFGRNDIIDKIQYIKPITSFRSTFGYVNNLWLVAADLFEVLAEASWEKGIADRIFTPLNMKRSSTGSAGLYTDGNSAMPHVLIGDQILPLERDNLMSEWVYVYGPAGGINSTVGDMARYLAMHQAKGRLGEYRLLTPTTAETLHAPEVPLGVPKQGANVSLSVATIGMGNYCLGWIRQEAPSGPVVWHNGGTSGMKAVAGFQPTGRNGIVVLSNLGSTDLPEALMFRWLDVATGKVPVDYSAKFLESHEQRMAAMREAAPKRPEAPLPHRALEAYAGLFEHPVYGELRVATFENRLDVYIGPKLIPGYLEPWDGDRFRVVLPPELTDGIPVLINFVANPDGKIVGAQFEGMLDDIPDTAYKRIPITKPLDPPQP